MVQWKQNKDIADSATALIPMACRPFHVGHYNLLTTAYCTNKKLICLISNTDRERKGEVPVYARTMKRIIDELIRPWLPENVEIRYVDNPIKATWKILEESSDVVYTVYGDTDDIKKRFSWENLKKWVPTRLAEGNIKTRAVQRDETNNISGTLMRQWLAEDDYNRFCIGLPKRWKGETVKTMWDLLRFDMQRSRFIVPKPMMHDEIVDKLIEQYEYAPDQNHWTKIKWQLTKTMHHDLRSVFSKRHPQFKTQHPNMFEYELMKLWVEMSEKPLTYTVDDEEFVFLPEELNAKV
jgi:nicotinamide mononucleotide adenylyltransferase